MPLTPDTAFDSLASELKPDPGLGDVAVDAAKRLFVVQGGRWYRAEYQVTERDAGSTITMTLLNVAKRAHWAGALTGWKEIAAAPKEFEQLAKRIG
ncbi:MAG: hypothetical protein EPN91_10580 [Salinibacterium sp.]|nr:MAG: hypothetical protein EPN91_10580 [Salinibacterium sp.]